jgi:hypothetical protein
MTKLPGWEQWEHDVQETLGLDATICSGSKFNDIGDATDNCPPQDDSFRLLVDCKYTEAASHSVTAKFMGQWVDRATEHGKRFVLALRLWPRGAYGPRDYVVLTLDDFAELLGLAREGQQTKRGWTGLQKVFEQYGI